MTLLQSFDANFIVRGLTLKGLETDTLYLVFKDQIVFRFFSDPVLDGTRGYLLLHPQ